jgi:adenylate kinase family enzyme
MRRVALTSSAPGNGKTTLGRELARRLDVRFVELDELAHEANWVQVPAEELRRRVEPLLRSDGWVIDALYRGKLGDLIPNEADVVIWLDLPIATWLPRLLRRSVGQIVRGEPLWHGNRQTWRATFAGATTGLRQHYSRRRRYPAYLAPFAVVRLRSAREVREWLATVPDDDPPS